MAHELEYTEITFYQTTDGSEFKTKAEATAYEALQDRTDNLKDLSETMAADYDKIIKEISLLKFKIKDLEKSLKEALAEGDTKNAESYQEELELYNEKLKTITPSAIELEILYGQKNQVRDTSLNAYESFRSFVIDDTETFIRIVAQYSNAYNYKEVAVDEDSLWYSGLEEPRGKRVADATAAKVDESLVLELKKKV